MDRHPNIITANINAMASNKSASIRPTCHDTGQSYSVSTDATNTSEARSRIPKACENCRKRKRKCDGASPCSWCCKKDLECIFVLERPKRKKQGSELVSDLEDQVLALKDYARKLEAACGHANLETLDSSYLTGTNLGQDGAEPEKASGMMTHESHNSEIGHADVSHFSAINDVSSMMWRMSIHDSGETSFLGPSGSFCFPSTRHGSEGIIKGKTNDVYSTNPPSNTDYAMLTAKTPEIEDSTLYLLGLFRQHINPIHQFVPYHVLDTMESKQISLDLELLQMSVLAAASLLMDDAKTQKLGQEYADRAEVIVMRCCREFPNVSTAQSLSILSWRELGLENENNAWLYNSMAASLVVQLGLHVSSFQGVMQMPVANQNDDASGLETEKNHIRIQTFWSNFLMDRVATSMLGRNCMLPWRRVRATPYIEGCNANPRLEDIVFNSLCRMWFIHDQYMDKIYSFEFGELQSAERHRLLLEARDHHSSFFSQLTDDLELKKNNIDCKVILLHMVYHMSLLLIHRPYLKEPKESAIHRLSVRTTIAASHALVKLIRQYDKDGSLEHAPFFSVHCILTAAVSLLLNATATDSSIRNQSVYRFRVCVTALEAMQKRWPRAKRGLVLLRELAYRWKAVSALPLRHSVPPHLEAIDMKHQEPQDPGLNAQEVLTDGRVNQGDKNESQLDWGVLFFNLDEPLDLVSVDLSTPTAEWLFPEPNDGEASGKFGDGKLSDASQD
ncbi:hypothetical protein FVEN_g6713 [Fusarium venenatum]|uniref:uncharacterized protein n=1 Tax=Fusarium venenatum TaxID=56646 RepID=UPI001DFE5A44|nr:hypothetical protein FVEN_g6713 [Fusarium venenatum]KAH7006648.1 hypothetical protein EDB82DRAFT_493965 [Fusarium venenatum]